MHRIHCPKTFVLWLVHRFSMARNGMRRTTSSLSKIMYYNPRHTWGWLNEPYGFTPKKIVENTWNEGELRNMLRPIQAFSIFYKFWLLKTKVDWLQHKYLDPEEDGHATLLTRRFFVHGICLMTFETISRRRKNNHIFKRKLRDIVAILPNHRTFRASPNPSGVQPMPCAPKRMSSV